MNNKIVLGTVQFGLDYGINNKGGKVPRQEVFKILDFASDNDIELIDVAQEYGDSEEILGDFIKEENPNFKIISKSYFYDSRKIRENLDESLKKLNMDKIYGYLIHDFKIFKENPEIIEILKKLKQEKKIEKIGFSVYYPNEVRYLLDNNVEFDLIQIPFNVFDQRFSSLLRELRDKGIEIHARSVFLQGLLFKNPEELDERFVKIKDKLMKLREISEEIKVNLSSLLVNFVSLNENIDKIVIGVDSLDNLMENLDALNDYGRVQKVYKELLSLKVEDEDIILPINWNQAFLKKA